MNQHRQREWCQSSSPGCGAALRARAEGLEGLRAAFCSPRASRGQQVLTDQAGHNCPCSPTAGTATRSPPRSGGLPRAPSCSPAPAQGDALESHVPAGQAAAMPSPKVPVPSPQDATPRDGGIARCSLASSCVSQLVREPQTRRYCWLIGGSALTVCPGWQQGLAPCFPCMWPHAPQVGSPAVAPASSDGAGQAVHSPVGCCSDHSSLQEKFPGKHAY